MRSFRVKKNQVPLAGRHFEDDEFIEACFLDSGQWIMFPAIAYAHKVSEYLTHRISRRPLDLISHTQRIRLCYELRDADGTYGALLDLFIALGDKGLALRQRLLRHSARMLTLEHYKTLFAALKHKINASDHLPASHSAVLSAGIAGKPAALVRQHQGSMHDVDEEPLQIAQDLLNSGQIVQAQSILKLALLANPQSDDISLELLQIYRHTHNRSACIQLLRELGGAPLAVQDQWAELIYTLGLHHNEEKGNAQRSVG